MGIFYNLASMKVLGTFGQLRTFIKNRFNTPCISRSFRSLAGQQRFGWKLRKNILRANSLDVARRFVSAGCGQSLNTIIVAMRVEAEAGSEIVEDFLYNCPNFISLGIQENEELWLRNSKFELEHLRVFRDM